MPTEAELANLPLHMRRTEICDGELAPFRLVVELDGAAVVDRIVRPAGARADRPVYVLDELKVAPGPHRVAVVFSVEGESETAPLRVAASVDVGARDVVLVTRDEHGTLVVR